MKVFVFLIAFFVSLSCYAKTTNLKNVQEQIKKTDSKKGTSLDLLLLTGEQYNKLSLDEKRKYFSQVKQAWVQFEKMYPQKFSKNVWFQSFLLDSAFADDAEETNCIIGGVVLKKVNGYCPTKSRPCKGDGISDGFQCGEIFNKICISRIPISNLSQTCYEKSKDSTPTVDQFNEIKEKMEGDYKRLCLVSNWNIIKKSIDSCYFLVKRVNEINRTVKNPPLSGVTLDDELSIGQYRDMLQSAQREKEAQAKKKISEGACPNEYDPVTGYRYAVPLFNLDQDKTCIFSRNQKLLNELSQKDCKNTKIGDELVKTRLRPVSGGECVLGDTCFDSIIENVITNEDGTISMSLYRAQIKDGDVLLPRETIKLKKTQNGYQLMEKHDQNGFHPYDNNSGPIYKIENVSRTNLFAFGTARDAKSKEILSQINMAFADNCRLLEALKKGGYTSGQLQVSEPERTPPAQK